MHKHNLNIDLTEDELFYLYDSLKYFIKGLMEKIDSEEPGTVNHIELTKRYNVLGKILELSSEGLHDIRKNKNDK